MSLRIAKENVKQVFEKKDLEKIEKEVYVEKNLEVHREEITETKNELPEFLSVCLEKFLNTKELEAFKDFIGGKKFVTNSYNYMVLRKARNKIRDILFLADFKDMLKPYIIHQNTKEVREENEKL